MNIIVHFKKYVMLFNFVPVFMVGSFFVLDP